MWIEAAQAYFIEERKYCHSSSYILTSALYSKKVKTLYIFKNLNILKTAASRQEHSSILTANNKAWW